MTGGLRAANSYQARRVLDVAAHRRVALIVEGKKRKLFCRVRHAVQLGQHGHGGVLQLALITPGRVVEPVVAEGVRHDVRGNLTVDALHDEERCADRSGVGLEPPGTRHRHGGEIAHPADHLELPLEVVGREHGDVLDVGCDASDQGLGAGHAVLGPFGREQHGLARHAVGGGRPDFGHARAAVGVETTGQPSFETLAHLFGIATRPVHIRHLGRTLGRSRGPRRPPHRQSSTSLVPSSPTRGSRHMPQRSGPSGSDILSVTSNPCRR